MITRLYALLLLLYPRAFRAEFGNEMQAVFRQAIAERTGIQNALLVFCRELKELPGSALHQHWAAIRKGSIFGTTYRRDGIKKQERTMLRNKAMQIWRKIILLLMLIAISGPWMLDAGESFPGILLFIYLFSGVFGSFIWILTAERLLLEGLVMSFGGTWFIIAPVFSMLILIASKDQPFGGGERRHVRILSSAIVIGGIALGFGKIALSWKVWGIWLYLILLVSEVVMEVIMIISDSYRSSNHTQPRQPGTWVGAILASLPNLLMGLLIGLGKLSVYDINATSQTIYSIIAIGLAILVVGVLLFAWRRGWPLWSASWYLYGAWVTFATISLTVENLNLEESWRYTNALFLICILSCIVGYFALLQKSKLHGLLSVAFLFPLLGLMFVEFVPNPIEGWLSIGLSLLAALVVGATVRIGDFRIGLGLVLGLNLIAGLSIAYISEYQMLDLPAGASPHIPQFGSFLQLLGFYAIFGLGVIAIPFILRGMWNLGKSKFAS